MGSQQLLLLVLSLMVVLSMIYVGTLLYNEYVEDNNRNQVIASLSSLADMCLTHLKKPAELGGGDGAFLGWKLPPELSETVAGNFKATVRANRINLRGVGVETGKDNRRKIIVKAIVKKTGITIRVKN